MSAVITKRITKNQNVCGGKACIAGHRIRVMDIAIMHDHLGMSDDEIIFQYPSLKFSDIHAALTYYFDNIEEIRSDIRNEKKVAQQLFSTFPSKLKERPQDGRD